MKILAIGAAIALAAPVLSAPVTREQLVAMAREKVDPSVMRALVERDCVDFDVDAANAAELSKVLPAAVLEAAIACRRTAPAAPSSEAATAAPTPPASASPPAERAAAPPSAGQVVVAPPRPSAPPAPPPPAATPSTAAGAEVRLRAVFIGESSALACSCMIDGRDVAVLRKEAQGSFGEAVERAKIGRESGYVPSASGRHVVVFRCDPGAQIVTVPLDLSAGDRRTVEIAETAFRHWKLRKIEKK